MCKAWCIVAPEFTRKRTHLRAPITEDDIQDELMIEAAVNLMEPPEEEAIPDYIKDELEHGSSESE